MRMFRVAATAAVLAGALVATAPGAQAASFTHTTPGGGKVTYNDGTDTFCMSLPSSSSYDVLSVTVRPDVAGRGPTHSFSVKPGGKKCRSLATAYEDSAYRYNGMAGFDPPCRCGSRFGDDFYS